LRGRGATFAAHPLFSYTAGYAYCMCDQSIGGLMRASLLSLAVLACVAPGLAGSYAQTTSAAESDKREFDIAAQPLSQALREYAQQSGDQIVFYSDIGQGRESAPVQGRYTRQEALEKLLENTGLKSERVTPTTVAIGQEAAKRGARATAPITAQLAAVSPPSRGSRFSRTVKQVASETSLFGVEEVIVTGTAAPQRTKFESSNAISTFNTDDITQHSPASSADLISAVPGFWVESTSGTTQGNVFARGIIQDGGYRFVALLEDGIPIYPISELSFYNADQFVRVDRTIERVEALRGGTAPIFTAGAVGGTVNFVTRKPSDVARGLFSAGFSDYNMYRTDVSWTAPVGEEWGLGVGGYYRRSDGVRDPGYTADAGGQLRVNLVRTFETATLDVFAKYIDDRSLFVVPIPLTGGPSNPRGLGGADPGTYSLQSEDLARAGLPPSAAEVGLRDSDLRDGIHPQLGTLGAKLDWYFGETASLTNLARYTNGDVRFDAIFPGEEPIAGTTFAAANGVAPTYSVLSTGAGYAATQLVQNHGHWVVNKEFGSIQNDLRLNFSVASHALSAGLYLADYSMADRWSLGNVLLMDVSDRPRRLSLPGVTDAAGFTQYSLFNLLADYDATLYSLYGADEWELTDRLRVDIGVRYDDENIEGSISDGVIVDLDGNPTTPWDNETSLAGTDRRRVDASFDNLSWSIGFNYLLTPEHAVFGHYTDSARLPHFDNIRDGVPRKDPVTNVELGYKTSLDRLAVFATLFQTEFDNVTFQDIDVHGAPQVRTAGTRTRGIELEGELRPIDALNVRFSITWQDPEYRDFAGASIDNTGKTIRRIPRRMARVTPTYSFFEDRARVFLTYTHAGKRFANDENTRILPAYNKLDAGLMLDVGESWTLQLSADNLTDEVGLTEANPRTDVGAGANGLIYMARPLFGRSFLGSVTYRY
jgi:iron complex outermembrane receptor protein